MASGTNIRLRIDDEGDLEYTAVDGTEEERRAAIEELEKIAREAAAEPVYNNKPGRLERLILAILLAYLSGSLVRQPAIVALTQQLNRVDQATKGLREAAQKEIDRAQGVVNHALVHSTVRALRTAHRTAIIFSPYYRGLVAQVYDQTASVSREVFGQSQFMNSALTLVQLAIYDASRLSGEPVDVAESRFFSAAQDITEHTARQSRSYSRVPGLFWADINTRWVNPEAERASRGTNRERGRINALAGTVNTVSKATTAVTDRFDEYREELGPFVEVDKLLELDRIRRDFSWRVEQPLADVATFLSETFPPVEEALKAQGEENERLREEIDELAELTADPRLLKRSPRNKQAQRFSEWAINAGTPRTLPEEFLREGQERISDVARSLPDAQTRP